MGGPDGGRCSPDGPSLGALEGSEGGPVGPDGGPEGPGGPDGPGDGGCFRFFMAPNAPSSMEPRAAPLLVLVLLLPRSSLLPWSS